MDIDIEKQKAFIDMLRDGFTLNDDDIQSLFDIEMTSVGDFVAGVIKHTGLDIKSAVSIAGWTYYFLVDDVRQETAGLDEMFEVTEEPLTDTEEVVEYQDGHYIMWVCPNAWNNTQGDDNDISYSVCGKFHKVDLGDEELTVSKTVQCVQCGQKYQIKPK